MSRWLLYATILKLEEWLEELDVLRSRGWGVKELKTRSIRLRMKQDLANPNRLPLILSSKEIAHTPLWHPTNHTRVWDQPLEVKKLNTEVFSWPTKTRYISSFMIGFSSCFISNYLFFGAPIHTSTLGVGMPIRAFLLNKEKNYVSMISSPNTLKFWGYFERHQN